MKVPVGEALVERDPNEINDHLKVSFEDVLAEPDGAHSFDCTWQLSYRCFHGGKTCCYKLLSCVLGCWSTLWWGWGFACITFMHVWYFTPCLRGYAIMCGCCQKLWGTTLQCILAPICETMGLCLSKIGVQQTTNEKH